MAVYRSNGPPEFEDGTVRSHVVTLNLPGAYSSFKLFWDAAWKDQDELEAICASGAAPREECRRIRA